MKKTLMAASVILIFLTSACSLKKANIDNNLKQFFDAQQAEGCFTMMDNKTGAITVYNITYDTLRFSPAASFYPFLSLVGLETGKITSENMQLSPEATNYADTSWNKSLNLTQAFSKNAFPYFTQVAKLIAADTLQHWIDTVGYGNKNIGTNPALAWQNGSLKISPDEQVGLMKRLYFDQLPFRKSTQQSVRNLLLKEDNTAFKLSYVTASNIDSTYGNNAWLTGYIEENKHVYFFAALLTKLPSATDAEQKALQTTKAILKHYGFFEGKK
jgi:beta-lactamase class D